MKKFTYDEAYTASLQYFNGDELASKVFLDKYALRDDGVSLLENTPEMMHRRLAKEFARIELNKFKNPLTEEELFSYFDHYRFIIPQGSPMFGIGNHHQIISLSNCFVLESPADSYGGIMRCDEQLVQVSKRRGGNGINVSNLRPVGSPTKNSSKTSTGVVNFCERFSNSIREVGQCIAKGELVLTHRGLIPIETVRPDTDKVWTKKGWVKVLKKFSNGPKRIFQTATKAGFKVKTSEEHVFQTFNDNGELLESPLSGLKIGDGIVLSLGDGSFNADFVKLEDGGYKNSNRKPANCILPDILSEDLAYFLGYSYGDGSVEARENDGGVTISLACSNNYPEIKELLSRKVEKIFDYTMTKRKGDGDLEKIDISNKTIVQFLKHNGLLKQLGGSLIFPEKIIRSSAAVQMAFLSGYFDADGYASGGKKGYCFASIDCGFLEQCQSILLANGIASKIHKESRMKLGWKDLFSLYVVGAHSQKELVSKALFSWKIQTKRFVSKRDCWTTPFKSKSSNIKSSKFNYCPDNFSFISLICADKLKEDGQAITNNLIQDEITFIEYIGEEETYDLQLEEEHLFWCQGFYLHNSGRRGALLEVINIHHPESVIIPDIKDDCWKNPSKIILKGNPEKGERDIETLSCFYNPNQLDFASMKLDRKKVTGANVSIALTDEFLTSVENDTDFEQRFPVDAKNATIRKQTNARNAWRKIIHMAWQSAEPGLLFWDRITKYNAVDCYAKFGFGTIATNPCLPAYSNVLTPYGMKTIGDIKVGDRIWSESGWTTVVNKFVSGVKGVFKYKTTFGSVSCTKNHKIVSKGLKVEAKNAGFIDVLRGFDGSNIELSPNDIVDGLVIGDGMVHKAGNNLVLLCVGEDDRDYFTSEVSSLIENSPVNGCDYAYKVNSTISANELCYTYNRSVPNRFKSSPSKTCGFLRGLYSANGSVVGGRIILKASSFSMIEDVQKMLSSIGIVSYYTTNKPSMVKFSNGDYLRKESYDLNITRDRAIFYNKIGFIQQYKQEKLLQIIQSTRESDRPEKLNKEIIGNDFLGNEEVFDITVDNETHTFWCDGFNISNCGEVTLCANDSCRLLLLNLLSFVVSPFTKDARFDFELFTKITAIAQRLMDDLVDLELEKIDQIITKITNDPEREEIKRVEFDLWKNIREKCEQGRRTGLGTTGLADALAALNLSYASKDSITKVDEIFKAFKHAAFDSSCEMAKEIGTFPIWDWNLEKDSEFLKQIEKEKPELYVKISKYGRRNIGLLTLSPAGTVSIQTQTSSGGEPVFAPFYTRRKKINPNDKDSRVDFVDEKGDSWQHFKVYHPPIALWMKVTGETDITKSPYHNCYASDIDWEARVELQATIQKHVDHSISSCLALGESMIQTNNGLFKIEEIVPKNSRPKEFNSIIHQNLTSVNIEGKESKIDKSFNNGIASCKSIKFIGGNEIVATNNHRLAVLDSDYSLKWKFVAEIKKGDLVVGRKGLNMFPKDLRGKSLEYLNGSPFVYKDTSGSTISRTIPDRTSLELARLLGYLCSDGSISKYAVRLSQQKNNVCLDFIDLMKRLFGFSDPTIYEDGRSSNLLGISFGSKKVSAFLNWLGITNHDDIEVPRVVRLGTKSQVKEFIKGATLDGHVGHNQICVATSVSQKYLRQIQSLLFNLNINSTLQRGNKAGEKVFPGGNLYKTQDSFCLMITESSSLSNYLKNIGFAEDRKNKEAYHLLGRPARIKKHGLLPDFEIRKRFRTQCLPKIKAGRFYNYLRSVTKAEIDGQNIDRETLLEMRDFGLYIPSILLDDTYLFSKVKSSSDAGERQTYDLSVSDGHSYLANSLINHNTINLPSSATEEDVAKIYTKAWKTGCKGLTVYREGSRSGVLIKDAAKNLKIEKTNAPKRPVDVEGEIFAVSYKKEKLYVAIGFFGEHDLYEVFVGLNNKENIERGKGIIRKISRGKYVFICDNGEEIKLNNGNNDDSADVVSRLLSVGLRHGVPIEFLCAQLSKAKGDITSFAKVIQRVLKKYIPEGKILSSEHCESCGSVLTFENGCKICKSCGWSACS